MFIEIENYIKDLTKRFDQIPAERKEILSSISIYVQQQLAKGKHAELIYVCTHNSRRSHFGQVWGKTAAAYYNIPNINTYSAGTEATAMNANAINALKRVGFAIHTEKEGTNPLYKVEYDNTSSAIYCFSKTYKDESIPSQDLCAIMTCTEADGNCPFIPGTALRVSCPYEDPKAFDGTPQQDEQYDARCRQIALENLYLFSLIGN